MGSVKGKTGLPLSLCVSPLPTHDLLCRGVAVLDPKLGTVD